MGRYALSKMLSQAVPGQPSTVYIEHPPHPGVETGGVAGGPVLISVPHSGRYYPRELVDQVRLPIDDLRMLEDLLVDHLIEEAVGRNVHTITNNYARAWLDLHRRTTELDPSQLSDRTTVVWGKSVSVRVDLEGYRINQKKKKNK